MESGAEDYHVQEGIARVVTSMEDYISVDAFLRNEGRHIDSSDLMFAADTTISLDEKGEEKLQRLIEVLEEDEDVDTVWHNAG